MLTVVFPWFYQYINHYFDPYITSPMRSPDISRLPASDAAGSCIGAPMWVHGASAQVRLLGDGRLTRQQKHDLSNENNDF